MLKGVKKFGGGGGKRLQRGGECPPVPPPPKCNPAIVNCVLQSQQGCQNVMCQCDVATCLAYVVSILVVPHILYGKSSTIDSTSYVVLVMEVAGWTLHTNTMDCLKLWSATSI